MSGPSTHLLGERYRLVERLGAGGMSVVWRGYDEVLGRQVAVKVLAARLASDPSLRRRVRLEAKAAARLCHPHITSVYDYGESAEGEAPIPYVVMELVDGESLAARLARDGSLPWREAVIVCAEVAAALVTAHGRGVVHRDVTPGNVMLTLTGAKVVDFGISALVGERDAGPDGSVLGTPAYLAPERLDGGQVSAAADIYALGLLLYRTLTGRLPWPATTKTEVLRAHLYHDPEPMPPIDGLPAEVADLYRRCVAKAPDRRPGSAEVARTLAEAAGVAAVVPISPAPAGAPGVDPGDELANVGTTILPRPAATDVFPLPRSTGGTQPRGTRPGGAHPPGAHPDRTHPSIGHPAGKRRSGDRRPARNRVRMAGIGVGLLAVTGLIWASTARGPLGSFRAEAGAAAAATPAAATPAAATNPVRPGCRVEYALRKDSGKGFAAGLRVTNTGATALAGWRLSFAFPGDQDVTAVGSGRWRQDGRTVTIRPAAGNPLTPGRSVALGLTGTYAGSNPLPFEFRLNDASCAVLVSAAAGQPQRTVGAPAAHQPARTVGDAGGSGGSGGSGGEGKGKGKGKDKGSKSEH